MRSRLFRKYVALFVAVVCVALLTNGLSEMWFYYRDHKASLIHIQREQADAAYTAPRTDIEAVLCGIFSLLLGVGAGLRQWSQSYRGQRALACALAYSMEVA
jgi:hypothetical protein